MPVHGVPTWRVVCGMHDEVWKKSAIKPREKCLRSGKTGTRRATTCPKKHVTEHGLHSQSEARGTHDRFYCSCWATNWSQLLHLRNTTSCWHTNVPLCNLLCSKVKIAPLGAFFKIKILKSQLFPVEHGGFWDFSTPMLHENISETGTCLLFFLYLGKQWHFLKCE